MGMNNRQYTDTVYSKKLFITFNEVYKTGQPAKGFGWQIIRKDGTKRYIEASVSLQKDSSGKPIGFRGITRDITERKQMEDVIHQSEERYRTILDEMENGYFEVDLAGNYIFVNDANARQLGYSREEMLRLNFRVPMVKESIDIVRNAFSNIYITDKPQRGISYKAKRKDGTTGFAEISGFPMKNEKGEIIGFRGMAFDITERKQAESQREAMLEKLRESEGRLRGITRNLPGIVIYQFYATDSGEYEINYVSERMHDFFGLETDRKEDMFRVLLSRIHEKDREEFLASIEKAVRTGTIWNFEGRITIISGEMIWFHGLATPTRQKDRLVFDGILMDITERKHAEEKLQQTLDSLKKAVGTTIQVLVSALESRDPYTAGHQARSAHLACAIATEMGLPSDKIDGLRMAGSIHDIGKLSIAAEILSKPTKLTNLEFSLIKEHSQSGYEMLKDVESPWPLAEIVYQHHERINGTGYPRNLKGEEIIMEARIMGVADVVEAMASHRPYRPGLGIEVALEEIKKNKGILYDEAVADVCLKLFLEKGYKFPLNFDANAIQIKSVH